MIKNKTLWSKIIVLSLIATLVILFFYFDLLKYIRFEHIKAQQLWLNEYYLSHPLLTISIFFITYVLITAISLPGATLMTIAAGVLFGNVIGIIIVSFASTIGATLAFLLSRFILRDWVEKKFSKSLNAINQGIVKEGAFYLFSLRLVPLFPFFIVNLVMGLTQMKTLTFALVSQVGMLAATIIFVNAGTQIAQIQSVNDILSFELILSFSLLGLLPLISKKILQWYKARKKSIN